MYKYSDVKNVQMLVYLMKEHGIKKVVISPGATHIGIIASLQCDPFFELYSEVDERNAAYLACGLAMESGEKVALTCTGATASRNYLPGLSEAFYRKLPILVITGAQDDSNAGNLIPQYINRSVQPVDSVVLSVNIQEIKDDRDEWDCNLKLNKAMLALTHRGGGPVHINMNCNMIGSMNINVLPETRIIRRYTYSDILPEITNITSIAVTVGGHKPWSQSLTESVDKFCEAYGAVVFVDHSSNYHGKYRILPTLSAAQDQVNSKLFDIDLLIHIGEQSGDYYTFYKLCNAKKVWRVSEDGEIRDTFKKLESVFDMTEEYFFNSYAAMGDNYRCSKDFYEICINEIKRIEQHIPELPFSNIWAAQYISKRLPENSVVHLGVSNTQRAWTFFDMPNVCISTANVGCRGIDGALSSALGMSLADKERKHFCFLGDLTFFYNMNALGNRYLHNNLRIMLINNGSGAEFHMYTHPGKQLMKEDVNSFVAASGHFGSKSPVLVKAYAEALGFEYICATNKEEFIKNSQMFLYDKAYDKPMLFEVFTDCDKENEALYKMKNILESEQSSSIKQNLKNSIKKGMSLFGK